MHELGRPGRRPARQVIHFAHENRITPARRITRDAAAIDTATDDSEVEYPIQRRFPGIRLFILAIWLSVLNKSQRNAKASENGNSAESFVLAGHDESLLRGSLLRDDGDRSYRRRVTV
jgi:hypothetical protein